MATKFGTIKRYFADRGFGFIEPEEGGEDVFFHISNAQDLGREPEMGDRVAYEEREERRGPRAVNVRPPVARSKGYRFLNPYNFVRSPGPPKPVTGDASAELLGRCPPPPHDRWVGLSGTIVCEVEAVSPLFISDSDACYATPEDEARGHKTYHFFHYDSVSGPEPALPASSLRGMVRSVFEAVTNSCYAHFDYDKRLSYHLPAAEALKLTPARVERARLFGPGGDLEIWRGGKGFRWRYVGLADNAPEGKKLPWPGDENHPVFWREQTALLWGNRPEGRVRWHDNRVAGAALTYPISGAPERVKARYREYTQAGRPFAVWYTGLEE